ncbi:MAG: DUF3108 domain-containing protein [Desulfuromonadaceae bacterium]
MALGRASHNEVIDCFIAGAVPAESQSTETPSLAGPGVTNTHSVAARVPSSPFETQPAISAENSNMDTPPAPSVEKRNVVAEEASVVDTPHDNVAPVIPAPHTQTSDAVQNGSPATAVARETGATGTAPIPDIFPFVKERLTFSLYWSGIHVGTATLEAVRGEVTSSITSVVHSNAVISSFYKVDDRAEARLTNGRPTLFTLLQSEGKHRGNKETIFEPERNRVTYINHLNKSRQEHDMSGQLLWDVISGFYFLRRQPLEVGTSVYISMFDSNKFHNAEVKVLRREMVEMEDGGEISTIIVEPILKSDGLFQKSGEMLVWLTDDERRMPVRMEAKIKIGRVTARLKSYDIKNER